MKSTCCSSNYLCIQMNTNQIANFTLLSSSFLFGPVLHLESSKGVTGIRESGTLGLCIEIERHPTKAIGFRFCSSNYRRQGYFLFNFHSHSVWTELKSPFFFLKKKKLENFVHYLNSSFYVSMFSHWLISHTHSMFHFSMQ